MCLLGSISMNVSTTRPLVEVKTVPWFVEVGVQGIGIRGKGAFPAPLFEHRWLRVCENDPSAIGLALRKDSEKIAK